MLLAVTYLEAVMSGDKNLSEAVVESTDPQDLREGLTAISLMLMQWAVVRGSGNYAMSDIIKVAREVALKKATE